MNKHQIDQLKNKLHKRAFELEDDAKRLWTNYPKLAEGLRDIAFDIRIIANGMSVGK